MPISESFARRLLPLLDDLTKIYPTPFHLYDQRAIVQTHRNVVQAFADSAFRQYFAVKALPTPAILSLLLKEGSGLDCSSPVELMLAERLGARGDDIVFTSNNTSPSEYQMALRAGALITFDDRSMLEQVTSLPDIVAFRVSPHGVIARSSQMGNAQQSKFGVPEAELVQGYREAWDRGARHFGLHGMMCANELSLEAAVQAGVQVIEVGARVAREAGIELQYINIGGGLGIPYRPDDQALDLTAYADALKHALKQAFPRHAPKLLMELGRYISGPHGVLVSRVINRCSKAREIVGLDASMSALMRPGLYGAYHHLTLPFASQRPEGVFDVVGALCENFDKFAVDRPLPTPLIGDLALIHDTGAHGHAMGFTYNGRLRPAELMLTDDGDVVEIRRAETFDDHTGPIQWQPVDVFNPHKVR
ncbi:diaminopimelate decarboxylase [Pseudomonas sessilinigenes]|uniref:Diaminopimelate decarboxylase n=1 Tax=Pseudomonas sessilinigenes TaxID=658629 RepID=A0ABX8MLB2_9PSED|nr:diaminopimelate decarboxylase [Pseudomonas sessilinigenes]AZC26569.1 Diaminopimelate decarboxylase [Pseudomonas sessilinigenes]QXH39432.1 diaminopimelate decarboxylase [Pseudomonas sessilinigenes]